MNGMRTGDMDKVYDFAFIYEIKNRELDNVLLLKCELERRGYSVALIETWEQTCHRDPAVKAKAAVCYALYDEEMLDFVNQYLSGCRKFVNLQWEQVRTNGTDQMPAESHVSSGIYGIARRAVHICWGDSNYRKLTQKFGVPADHAFVTGSVTLDFLRKEFSGFYLSKESLYEQYGFDANKKLCLFISSFSYVDLPESIINSPRYQQQGFDVRKHYEISKGSRDTVLDWFEAELDKHPDTIIVYRPHPAEASASRLQRMCEKYSNFKVIQDHSIKQWIVVADRIYTWWSTSITEVYAAGKGCAILRPMAMPYENELSIYNGARTVDGFEAFDAGFEAEQDFPIPEENIRDHYLMDDEPAFIRVCDVLESILNRDEYAIDGVTDQNYTRIGTWVYNLKCGFKGMLVKNRTFYAVLHRLFGRRIQDMRNEYRYSLEMRRKNAGTPAETEARQKLIRQILEDCF